MLFKAVLSSLLVPAVLAIPSSGLATRIARRRDRQSQVGNRMGQLTGAGDVVYSNNWAGATRSKGAKQGTFVSVTGTFTVPAPSGQDGGSASVWVGIDGDTCDTAILQTGIDFTVSPSGPTYSAWYEFYPDYAVDVALPISAGDIIQLEVTASPDKTSGTVTINNLTRNQKVSQKVSQKMSATAPVPLCGRDAEWIVEDYMQGSGQVSFANFGTVTFENAKATGTDGTTYTPSGATIIDIKQYGRILTSTSVSETSVTIKHE